MEQPLNELFYTPESCGGEDGLPNPVSLSLIVFESLSQY